MEKDVPYTLASALCLHEALERQKRGIYGVEIGRELHDIDNRGLIIAMCNCGDKNFESLYDSEFILDEPSIWGRFLDGPAIFNKILSEKRQDYAILMDRGSDVTGMVPRLNPKIKSRNKILSKIPPEIAQFEYDIGTRVDTGVCAAETDGIESVTIKRETPYTEFGASAIEFGKNGVNRYSSLRKSCSELKVHDVVTERFDTGWKLTEIGEMDLSKYNPRKVAREVHIGNNSQEGTVYSIIPIGIPQRIETTSQITVINIDDPPIEELFAKQ